MIFIERLELLHWLYHGFDEGDFIFGEVVFGVELSVDFLDALAPVDVAIGREVLHGYKSIDFARCMLCILLKKYHKTKKSILFL